MAHEVSENGFFYVKTLKVHSESGLLFVISSNQIIKRFDEIINLKKGDLINFYNVSTKKTYMDVFKITSISELRDEQFLIKFKREPYQ